MEAVRAALTGVVDPELGTDIVELGMVRLIEVDSGVVTVEVALTIAACPLRDQLRSDVERHVKSVAGVERVEVRTGVMDPKERSELMSVGTAQGPGPGRRVRHPRDRVSARRRVWQGWSRQVVDNCESCSRRSLVGALS